MLPCTCTSVRMRLVLHSSKQTRHYTLPGGGARLRLGPRRPAEQRTAVSLRHLFSSDCGGCGLVRHEKDEQVCEQNDAGEEVETGVETGCVRHDPEQDRRDG